MALDYSGRKIWRLDVHGFRATEINETDAASTAVIIHLTAEGNDTLPGPKIELEFAFPASHSSTLQELQSDALKSAAALLQRFGQETAESLAAAAERTQKKKLIPAD